MEINKKLDTDNDIDFLESGSLAHASNIVINSDNNSVQNENAIEAYVKLEDADEKIVGHIACSNEFIIFTNKNRIIRYNEKAGTQNEVITNWHWGGGTVFGDYTYNVNNELIVAISERNVEDKVPLKSINLDKPNYDIYGDESKYTLNPPIPMFNLRSYNIINGSSLIWNGTYVVFIRFFSNENDYTHWFKLGVPIIVYNEVTTDTLESSHYVWNNTSNQNSIPVGRVLLLEEWAQDGEKNSKTIQLVIDIFDKSNTYKYYQIGYICTTVKHETVAIVEKKTLIGNNVYNITNKQDDKYTISVDDLTSTYFNLYNVNTLCNYNNRLYVADYIEENANINIEQIDTSKIRVRFQPTSKIDDSYAYFDTRSINNNNENIKEPVPVSAEINIPKVLKANIKSATPRAITYVWNNPDKIQLNSDFELGKLYKCYMGFRGSINEGLISNCKVYEIGVRNRKQVGYNRIGVDKDYGLVIPIKSCLQARGILQNDIKTIGFANRNGDIQWKGNIDECYSVFLKSEVRRYSESDYREPIYAYTGMIVYIPNFNDLKVTETIYDLYNLDETSWNTMLSAIQYNSAGEEVGYNYETGYFINVFSITFNDNILIREYNKNRDVKWAITDNVYNFFIHYVYPNGSYTDGVRIDNNEVSYNYNIFLGVKSDGTKVYFQANENSTIEDMKKYAEDNQVSEGSYRTVLKTLFIDNIQDTFVCNIFPTMGSSGNIALYKNNKGERFFRPYSGKNDTTDIAYGKFEFSNIPMYKGFVGYFISYEEPEQILCGRAILGNLQRNIPFEYTTVFDVWYQDFQSIGNASFTHILIGSPFSFTMGYFPNLYGAGYYDGKYMVNMSQNQFYYDTDEGIYTVVDKKIKVPGEESNGSPARITVTVPMQINLNPAKSASHADRITQYTHKRMGLLYNYTNDIYTNANKKLISLGYISYDEYIESKKDVGRLYGSAYNIQYNYDYYVYDKKYKARYKIFVNKEEKEEDRWAYKYGVISSMRPLILNDAQPYPLDTKTGNLYYPGLPINNWTYNDSNQIYDFHISKIGFPFVSRYLYHCRKLKHKPITRVFAYYRQDGDGNWNWSANYTNISIQPDKVDTMFEISDIYYDYTDKILQAFNKDVYSNYITHYKKTIRRSDVISDENVENNWKIFRPEQYKVISENKGNVVNITGIGSYLIVHCEHSMFMFNRDSSMKTENKDVQLTIPDAFDVDYVEVFTSNKGYAGIQVHDQYICSNYGYIFYDRDGRKLYRYNESVLEDITAGFKHLLIGEVTDINFAIDEKNMRMLALGKTKDDNVERHFAISYSFLSKYWVSTHTYWYDYIFNTKDNVYFINNNTIDKFNFSKYNRYINLIDNNINYFNGEFEEIDKYDEYGTVVGKEVVPYSFIDVVFNNQSVGKVLNYISYIINKNGNDNYSGNKLVLYTNCCFSDYVDIGKAKESIKDYKHPYYKYGVWFMNWFKNVIKEIKTIPPIDRHSGKYNEVNKQLTKLDNKLIVGKYFVIRFIFRDDNERINIDDIQCY